MSARYSNCTSETRTEVTAAVSKMEKLAKKLFADRKAFDRYQDKLSDIWFDLALGEFIFRTLYALAWGSAHLVEIPTMVFFI